MKTLFPIFSSHSELIYLDNANTTQKPATVIAALNGYYQEYTSNIHRANYFLSAKADHAFEEGRRKVQQFINAEHFEEIIFVRNATEGINLVAHCFASQNIKSGDEIVISAMEHHANIVPWQMHCERTGAALKVIPINDAGEIEMSDFRSALSEKTKLLSIVHVSNALGTCNPVHQMIAEAHAMHIPVLVDAAQSIYHTAIDVQAMDCDFLVFSGHKMYGPTGIGVLYGKRKFLEAMPPWMGGGDMIESVSFEKTIYNQLPNKFEAGTPHISGVIGLGAAIDFIQSQGILNIEKTESELLAYTLEKLKDVPSICFIGEPKARTSVVSFLLDGFHAADVGAILDQHSIAVRIGQHCAHPVMQRFGVTSTIRVSLACYNTQEDINRLVTGLHAAMKFLQ